MSASLRGFLALDTHAKRNIEYQLRLRIKRETLCPIQSDSDCLDAFCLDLTSRRKRAANG